MVGALAAHTAAIIVIAHAAVFADLTCSCAIDALAAVPADLIHAVDALTTFYAVLTFAYAAGTCAAVFADIILGSVEASPAVAAVML